MISAMFIVDSRQLRRAVAQSGCPLTLDNTVIGAAARTSNGIFHLFIRNFVIVAAARVFLAV